MNDELRDVMAGLALNGMLSASDWFGNLGTWKSTGDMQKAYAEEAYGFADAMLEARKKKYWVETEEAGIAAIKPRRRKSEL